MYTCCTTDTVSLFLGGSSFIFQLVGKIAPPVKVGIMDNVIVKDNKPSRESSATGNSKITRTWLGRLYQGGFWQIKLEGFSTDQLQLHIVFNKNKNMLCVSLEFFILLLELAKI